MLTTLRASLDRSIDSQCMVDIRMDRRIMMPDVNLLVGRAAEILFGRGGVSARCQALGPIANTGIILPARPSHSQQEKEEEGD